MQFSTRFSLALHILLYILEYEKEEKITSEVLADSTGAHPVNVRKVLSQLKEKNFIKMRAGIGGASLCQEPEQISLYQVFEAVEAKEHSIFRIHEQVNIACPVGKSVKHILDKEVENIQNVMYKEMKSVSLQDLFIKLKQQMFEEEHKKMS